MSHLDEDHPSNKDPTTTQYIFGDYVAPFRYQARRAYFSKQDKDAFCGFHAVNNACGHTLNTIQKFNKTLDDNPHPNDIFERDNHLPRGFIPQKIGDPVYPGTTIEEWQKAKEDYGKMSPKLYNAMRGTSIDDQNKSLIENNPDYKTQHVSVLHWKPGYAYNVQTIYEPEYEGDTEKHAAAIRDGIYLDSNKKKAFLYHFDPSIKEVRRPVRMIRPGDSKKDSMDRNPWVPPIGSPDAYFDLREGMLDMAEMLSIPEAQALEPTLIKRPHYEAKVNKKTGKGTPWEDVFQKSTPMKYKLSRGKYVLIDTDEVWPTDIPFKGFVNDPQFKMLGDSSNFKPGKSKLIHYPLRGDDPIRTNYVVRNLPEHADKPNLNAFERMELIESTYPFMKGRDRAHKVFQEKKFFPQFYKPDAIRYLEPRIKNPSYKTYEIPKANIKKRKASMDIYEETKS